MLPDGPGMQKSPGTDAKLLLSTVPETSWAFRKAFLLTYPAAPTWCSLWKNHRALHVMLGASDLVAWVVPPPGYRCNHVTSHMGCHDTTFPWFKGLVQRQSCDSRQPIRILLGTNLWILLEKGYFGRFVACNRCTTLVEVEGKGYMGTLFPTPFCCEPKLL